VKDIGRPCLDVHPLKHMNMRHPPLLRGLPASVTSHCLDVLQVIGRWIAQSPSFLDRKLNDLSLPTMSVIFDPVLLPDVQGHKEPADTIVGCNCSRNFHNFLIREVLLELCKDIIFNRHIPGHSI